MAAAQRLMESGFNNLMILEAQNYVGGRVCSQVMGKVIKQPSDHDAFLTDFTLRGFRWAQTL